MKFIMVSIVAIIGFSVTGSTMASDMPAEIKAKCGACHSIDKTIVGPSFLNVSEKYKGDKAASSKIAVNIAKGGSFGWFLGSMPPAGDIGANESEIQSMSEFIVKLAK
jgi:cytochrome c